MDMKHAMVLIALILAAGLALAADDKPLDIRDGSIANPGRIQITGTFTDSTPVWDRGYGSGAPDPACAFALTPAFYTGQFYEAHCFVVADQNPVEFEILADGTTLHDTTLHIFCDNFDPAMPLDACVYFDDDGGEGLLSAILAADNVVLDPSAEYYLVVSNYGSGDPDDLGDYVVNTSENVALCGGVAAEGQTWSSVKGLFE
jgi:hypothetical protein